MALAVVGIIYGALVAMVQPDLKRLIAYSSVSHLGFVMLGIFALNPQGVEGALYQMLNHGVSTGGLFLLVGMIYLRRHTARNFRISAASGTACRSMPAIFMFVMLSSIGLPGLNGFVGEFLIMLGAYLQIMAGGRPSPSAASSWARSTCSGPTSGSCSVRSPRPSTKLSRT